MIGENGPDHQQAGNCALEAKRATPYAHTNESLLLVMLMHSAVNQTLVF